MTTPLRLSHTGTLDVKHSPSPRANSTQPTRGEDSSPPQGYEPIPHPYVLTTKGDEFIADTQVKSTRSARHLSWRNDRRTHSSRGNSPSPHRLAHYESMPTVSSSHSAVVTAARVINTNSEETIGFTQSMHLPALSASDGLSVAVNTDDLIAPPLSFRLLRQSSPRAISSCPSPSANQSTPSHSRRSTSMSRLPLNGLDDPAICKISIRTSARRETNPAQAAVVVNSAGATGVTQTQTQTVSTGSHSGSTSPVAVQALDSQPKQGSIQAIKQSTAQVQDQ